MKVYEANNRNSSVIVAKNRLKNLLVSDRVNCTSDAFEKIRTELFRTISKYIEISYEDFEIQVTHTHIHIKFTGDKE